MSGKPALVSVIVPAYNASRFIHATVESLFAQTYTNLEIIVVDDGSDDDTISVARADRSQSVRVVTQSHRGASAARNAGLREANGEYVQFLDADDILSPSKIELQLDALSSAPAGSIASCPWVHFVSDPGSASINSEPVWATADPVEWVIESLSGGGMMQPAAWLTPRSVIDAAGPWDESLSLHDDGEFFTRVLLNSTRNVFVPEATVYYRSLDHSLSRRRSRQAVESALAVCRARHSALLRARDDLRARRAVATQYAQFAYEFQATAPDLADDAVRSIRELDAEPQPSIGGRVFRALSARIGFSRALRLRSAVT